MKSNILRTSSFESNPYGNGGNRRTAQITELVQSTRFNISNIEPVKTTRLARYFSGIQFLVKHPLKIFPDYSIVGISGSEYSNLKRGLSQHSGARLVLWESTKSFIVPYVAKDYGFKVIALPQNLESLVVSQTDFYTRKSLPESFENELKQLKKADAVFCISREEQWLLKLRGLDADFLPYYPPQPILKNLLKIRELRQTSQKQRFLVIGTANNPPTWKGMIEQLQWLEKIGENHNFEVDVAGYDTEGLREYFDYPNVNILGSVDSEKLTHLMIHARAVLAHQRCGTGALTRIPEMIIAGIPVIANSEACRSAFSYSGVYCYDCRSELVALMSQSLDTPMILERPIEAERRFVNCIESLAQE